MSLFLGKNGWYKGDKDITVNYGLGGEFRLPYSNIPEFKFDTEKLRSILSNRFDKVAKSIMEANMTKQERINERIEALKAEIKGLESELNDPEYKAKDWVYVEGTRGSCDLPLNPKGDVVQIDSFNYYENGSRTVNFVRNGEKCNATPMERIKRHATPEEITQATKKPFPIGFDEVCLGRDF